MVHDIHIHFANDWPWWAALLATAAALFTVVMFYRRAARAVSRRTLWTLSILRMLAMIALLLCLFRPAISYSKGTLSHSTLLVLADASRSMSVHDFVGQPSRFERVSRVLLERGGPMERLAADFRVEWFAFGPHAQELKDKRDLTGVKADREATDLVAAEKDALSRVDPREIAGILLFTDGIDTTAKPPAEELAKPGVPIFPIGVGSVLSGQENYRDIILTRVEAPREVTVKTAVQIEAYVDAIGYADRVVPVVLSEDGVEITRQQLVLDNAVGAQKVTLDYVPQKKGDFELTVTVGPDPEERITENNSITLPVFVSDPKIRVLYVEGVVRSEYREVRRALEFDPNIEVLGLVRTGPNVFYQQGNVTGIRLSGFPKDFDELKQFKVLILGSLDSSALTGGQMQDVKRFVSEGGGLMMIGGEFSFGPGGYGGTPIEEALPVMCGARSIGQERDPFPLALTTEGKAHPIFAGIATLFTDETGKTSQMPMLSGCVRVMGKKPTASVLAVNPNRVSGPDKLIAVAVERFGSGRSMAAAVDSTYLWYRPLRGMGKESPFTRYWGQAVRWLAGMDEAQPAPGPGIVAYMDKHFYDPGAAPVVRAFVTDQDGQATNAATVQADVRQAGAASGATVTLSLVPGTQNEYEGQLAPPEPGKYEVSARAALKGKELGKADLKFRVGAPSREFEKLDLDAETLKRIAAQSNGVYLPLINFDQLPDILRARTDQKIERGEIFLWNTPFLFVAFVLLITAEWILRKRRLLT